MIELQLPRVFSNPLVVVVEMNEDDRKVPFFSDIDYDFYEIIYLFDFSIQNKNISIIRTLKMIFNRLYFFKNIVYKWVIGSISFLKCRKMLGFGRNVKCFVLLVCAFSFCDTLFEHPIPAYIRRAQQA